MGPGRSERSGFGRCQSHLQGSSDPQRRPCGPGRPARPGPATHPLQMQLAELAQPLLALLRRQLFGRRGPVFRAVRGHLRSQPASGSASPPATSRARARHPSSRAWTRLMSHPGVTPPKPCARPGVLTSTSVAAAITAFSLLPATTASTSVGLQSAAASPAPFSAGG